jgi:hypothetical protein
VALPWPKHSASTPSASHGTDISCAAWRSRSAHEDGSKNFKKRNEIPSAEELLASINRALPFSDEAEKGVLSCLLQDPNERLSDCRVTLPALAFYHDANRTIYEKLLEFLTKTCQSIPSR